MYSYQDKKRDQYVNAPKIRINSFEIIDNVKTDKYQPF
jgi:hypothetical protein